MATISRRNFQMHFYELKCIDFDGDFMNLFLRVNLTIIPALVQIVTWWRPGDTPFSEPMMANLPTLSLDEL